MISTKDKILDAAEKLFAKAGFDATSLRAITTEAQVNLAAVNYHFKSKEALILEVFARHLRPVAEQRKALLDAYLALAGEGPLELEPILAAFIRPILEVGSRALTDNGVAAQCLMGRIYSTPRDFASKMFEENFKDTVRQFRAALHRALPDLPVEEILWRMHFTIGAMAHTLAGASLLTLISGGLCDTKDMARVERQLVAFAAAGLRAEVPRV
jgi:AcrR family transcriptional regulator